MNLASTLMVAFGDIPAFVSKAQDNPLWAIGSGLFLMFGIMLPFAIIFVWMERKVSGRIQDRLGPTRVGGKFGWLQTLADGVKLLCKEDSIPGAADHFLFRLAPYLAVCGSFVAFLALPFGNGVVGRELGVAVFFMLAVLSSEVFGVILAGYGSGSKWSLFGGIREAAQVVSYEVPRAICVLIPVIVVGSLNLSDFARIDPNASIWQSRGLFWNWYLFHDPFTFLAFVVFFICGTSSCKRAPFDLAEAESELVAGFHTEYSGFRWLLFFMAEYGSMFAISGIAAILWLGGWHTGILPFDLSDKFAQWFGPSQTGRTIGWILGNLVNVQVFILKGWAGVFIMIWVRWTLPRLRIDQVMMVCLKYLLPISCVLLVGIGIWQLSVDRLEWPISGGKFWVSIPGIWKYGSAAVCVLGVGFWLTKVWLTPSEAPPGVTGWATRPPVMPGTLAGFDKPKAVSVGER
jgi:NADH-quinone oxidoreductase subunit H